MARTARRGRAQTAAAPTSTYVYEIGLTSGDSIWAHARDGTSAEAELEAAHTRLGTEPFVLLGDTIVRSDDVRTVQLHETEGSEGGLLDDLKQRLGGGSMTSYETEERTTARRAGSRAAQSGADDGGFAERYVGYGQRPWSETKPFFLTSEFLTLLATIAAVAIGMAASDVFDSTRGFTLITVLAAAYMISRGLAKSGTKDPNPDRGARY